MSKEAILILGARSDIARATARHFASLGHPIMLAARRADELESDRADIALRHAVVVSVHEFDALATESHQAFVEGLPQLPGVAICAVGLMGTQAENQTDIGRAVEVMRSNYEGPASIFAVLANLFEARGSGCLVGISSVAGERGRASNYVYGSAKAGFTAFLSGLRNRLSRSGVHVVTVLPGFVATRMTSGLKLPARLTAQPDAVAAAIARAVGRHKDIIYVLPVWRLIMLIITSLPEAIFKKSSL